MGGNLIKYKGHTFTPNADLTTFKLLVNSTLSTPGAKFIDADISDFYLNSILPEPEWIRISFAPFPPDIIEHYKLTDKQNKEGYILAKVIKEMYGLPQAGRIAYEQLEPFLAQAGYIRAGVTPGLFKHKTRPIQFILVVDDFGIQFQSQTDLNHLIKHLRTKYRVTMGDGTLYCGVTIKWDYEKRTALLHMPHYISKALQRLKHTPIKV